MDHETQSRLERLESQIEGLANVCRDLSTRTGSSAGFSELVEVCRNLTAARLWANEALRIARLKSDR